MKFRCFFGKHKWFPYRELYNKPMRNGHIGNGMYYFCDFCPKLKFVGTTKKGGEITHHDLVLKTRRNETSQYLG